MKARKRDNTCKEDYLNAYERHWKDAEILFDKKRLGNADQLYGLSAECGLKAILGAIPGNWGSSGLEERYREHINVLWGRFIMAQGRLIAKYASLLPKNNPFSDWAICQRYVHERHFDRDRVGSHRQGAKRVRALVQEAFKDGVL